MTNLLPPSLEATSKKCEIFWIQFNNMGNLCLRLVTQVGICPRVWFKGGDLKVTLRVGPTLSFPIAVWETVLPRGIQEIEIEGFNLSIPDSIEKIGFIGDTGCRPDQILKETHWPFKKIAYKLMKDKADLIVHLGDCIYRHLYAQQKSSSHNLSSEEGDNWLGWKKEFFEPLKSILPFTPWVFIRGNQECRPCASEGWRRFLDGYPYHEEEVDYSPPYVIPLNKVNLIVHDSSYIDSDHERIWPYNQLEGLALPTSNPTWLLTHRPPWGILNNQHIKEKKPTIIINEHGNLQVFLEPFPPSLTTIFSGHIHAFQYVKLFNCQILQFVIGNGGVALEEDRPPEILRNTHVDNQKIEKALSIVRFGYGMAEYIDGIWKLIVKDIDGEIMETFSFTT